MLQASQRVEDFEPWQNLKPEMVELVSEGTTAVTAIAHARLQIASQFAETDDQCLGPA
jgi:hypothetical protein